MKTEQLVATISRMRDHDAVKAIESAAMVRSEELSKKAAHRYSKRIFSKYEHLKKGDQVFIHHLPRSVSNLHKGLFGLPLTVLSVHPRNKQIDVQYPVAFNGIGNIFSKTRLRWSVLDRLQVSTEPTPEALAHILAQGDKA